MRLVDADLIKWDIGTVWPDIGTRVVPYSDIEKAPTVEAITVEWIETYLDKLRAKFEEMDRFIMEEYAGYEDNFYRTKVRYIEEMLKDWRKENGANR